MAYDKKKSHKKFGGTAPKQGGTDSYKVHATETSVDYKAGHPAQRPGASGPDRVRSNASKKGDHAPVPGYSEARDMSSTDFKAGQQHEKPGGCGPSYVGGKRKHY